MEGKNLESVADEQTRETNGVEDTENPNEGELGIAGAVVGGHETVGEVVIGLDLDLGVLVDGTTDGPAGEGQNHTARGEEEQGATANLVDKKSSGDGDGEIENGLASGELL